MSCFPGRMREYKEISLDRFDGENLQSTAYFLSHKHEDHMQGLSASSFQYRLQSKYILVKKRPATVVLPICYNLTSCHVKFFCSEVTRDLLLSDSKHEWLKTHIIALPLDTAYILKVPDEVTGKDKYEVTVTSLHAGHCPGSVMFLFEGNQGTVLYTGDIRLNRSDLQSMNALHSASRTKHIDTVYLDTTFCVPNALFIPSREESTEAVVHLTRQWLEEGDHRYVVLKCSAGIGYEQLFIHLAQEFNTKVHVSKEKHKVYESVSVFPAFSTPDPAATRIHCCLWTKEREEKSRLPCGYLADKEGREMEVRTIMLSTMWFTQRATIDSAYCARKPPYYYRVCYSFHSSYSELRDLVLYLKPSSIRPNVIPYKEKDFTAVQERLNKFQKLACQSVPAATDSQPRELGLQRKRKRKHVKISASDESENMDWGDLSPVKRVKSSQSQELTFTVDYSDLRDGNKQADESAEADYNTDSDGGADVENTSDIDLFESLEHDEDVKQAMESFKPIHEGSYGSYVSYISDESDNEDDDSKVYNMVKESIECKSDSCVNDNGKAEMHHNSSGVVDKPEGNMAENNESENSVSCGKNEIKESPCQHGNDGLGQSDKNKSSSGRTEKGENQENLNGKDIEHDKAQNDREGDGKVAAAETDEQEEDGSSDVEEVGHKSPQCDDDVHDITEDPDLSEEDDVTEERVIDLTEDDEYQADSESLFSGTEEEGEVSLDEVQNGVTCYIDSDGVVCEADTDSDETVDEWQSDECEEIIISSDEDTSSRAAAKQTARKSTAKKASSSENINGNATEQVEENSIIVLDDSMDNTSRKVSLDTDTQRQRSLSNSECPLVFGADKDTKDQITSDCSDSETNRKLALTSEALSKKLEAAREMGKKKAEGDLPGEQNNDSNNIVSESESIVEEDDSQEILSPKGNEVSVIPETQTDNVILSQ